MRSATWCCIWKPYAGGKSAQIRGSVRLGGNGTRAVSGGLRDRILLLAAGAAVVVASVAASFVSYGFGFDDTALLVVIETVFAFGGRVVLLWKIVAEVVPTRREKERVLLTLSALFVAQAVTKGRKSGLRRSALARPQTLIPGNCYFS